MWLSFNGEIYNYVELRDELAATGVSFHTKGDTEVLLQSLIQWGHLALPRLNGMWALILVDLRSGKAMIARDRFGIKPLYIYANESGFYISSEIKGILKAVGKKFRVNPTVVNAFLNQNLLCTSRATFFAGIEEFPPAHWAISAIDELGTKPLNPYRYWTTPESSADHVSGTTLVDLVRDMFIDAVKIRLRSDVPVGVLLSGGTDSSAIAAVLHYLNPARHDIKLISAVAADGRDEQPFIDTVARYLSRMHRDQPEAGCVMAALGSELRREPAPVRRAAERSLMSFVGRVAELLPGGGDAALVAVSCMVGALTLARAVRDPELSERILRTNRRFLRATFASDFHGTIWNVEGSGKATMSDSWMRL